MQAIFLAIGNAAGTSGKSQAWFSQKKHERKKDELLRYLHQARHADEHGIAPIASMLPGIMTIRTPEGFPLFSIPGFLPVNLDPEFEKNSKLTVLHAPPQVALRAVENKGVRYEPPTEHLGTPLTDRSIANIAWLGLKYHGEMVIEAESMAANP
ncbi:hypothetical protein [Sinorhizobium medicae]